MRTHLLLTCCAAALALCACQDPPPASPARPSVAAPRAPLGAPAPLALAPDAGAGEEAAPEVDPLALEHSHVGDVDHLGRADRLREEGDVMGALAEARRAVADDPEDEDALAEAARLASLAERMDLAALAWGRLAQLEPDDAAPAIRQARALLASGELASAEDAAKDAIARDPQDPEAYQVAGRAYLAQDQLAGAISMFEQAVSLDPEHGYALNNLGFAYLRASRNEEAVQVLERAADLLPTIAFVHNNLGVALERTGRLDEARGAYGLASSLSPKYVKAQVNRARMQRTASAEGTE